MSFVGDNAGSLIGAGADLVTAGINAWSQNSINKRNIREARKAEERERAYNHPKAQMARLAEAGLNPNLIYGTGDATGQLNARSATSEAPQFGFSAIDKLRAAIDVKKEKKTMALLDEQIRGASADADIAQHNADVMKGRPDTLSTESPGRSVGHALLQGSKKVLASALDKVRSSASVARSSLMKSRNAGSFFRTAVPGVYEG